MSARRLSAMWDRVWFRPAAPLGPIGVRAVVCVQALWILLSRPDLPAMLGWPAEFRAFVGRPTLLRFGLGLLPLSAEWLLFGALHLALVGALLGVAPRVSCLVAAALLYHVAPLEELIVGLTWIDFGGLTLPVLALFVLAFAEPPRWRDGPSPEHRWPVALVQLLFSFNYLFATLAKLHHSGLTWFSGETIRGYALLQWSYTAPPLALWLADQPALCWAIGLGTLGLELAFPLAVVSQAAASVLAPLAFLFHVGIVPTLDIFFPSLPLLLLYLDWDRLDAWLRRAPRRARASQSR